MLDTLSRIAVRSASRTPVRSANSNQFVARTSQAMHNTSCARRNALDERLLGGPPRRPPRGRFSPTKQDKRGEIYEIEEDQDPCRTRRRLHHGDRAGCLGSERTPGPGRRAGGIGYRVRDEERLRQGHRQEGDRLADQARRHRHADPGRRLHDDRQGRGRLLQVRERQRRHQRPPDQVHALQRAAQPGAGGRAREEAGRERQGRRRRRQHELRRVRHELEVLQVQGLRRDRRRRPGGVLRHADLRRVEHGPALQQHRRRPGARPGRREDARGRLARHDLGIRRRRRGQGRPGGGHPVAGLPDPTPGH